MNADDHNGRSYAAGHGQEPSRDLFGSAQSPSSPPASPQRSVSGNSIKVELCSEDGSPGASQPDDRDAVSDQNRDDTGPSMEEGNTECSVSGEHRAGLYSPASASPGPIRLPSGKLQCEVCGMICIGPNVLMVHKRSHTGERPFQCNQCGASFTQKGNLLRHIKLHSGEKPFKCPICNYACRRRDALAGHLRTHAVSSPTVGKPFKCSFCSRSYKQQSTLEEHQERCHSYLKNQREHGDAAAAETTRPALQPSSFVDRLAISLTKRKRSTPQKFSAEKQVDLDLPEAPYELSSGSEKETEQISSQHSGDSTGLMERHVQGSRGKGEGPALSQLHPAFMCEFRSTNLTLQGPQGVMAGHELPEGRDDPSAHSRITSPNGCPDSTDTESTPEEQSTRATVPTSTSNNHHLHHQILGPSRNHSTSSPIQTKELDPDWARACPAPPAIVRRISGSPVSSREMVQVLDGDGQTVRSFHCRHCRILFLDHVMFTIHMGCHGFRQPFECNICGHRSQDRYEFSSHISRGEHQVG